MAGLGLGDSTKQHCSGRASLDLGLCREPEIPKIGLTLRGEGLLQVLDDVDLDARLLRNLQSSLRRVSVRVVEDRHAGHGR